MKRVTFALSFIALSLMSFATTVGVVAYIGTYVFNSVMAPRLAWAPLSLTDGVSLVVGCIAFSWLFTRPIKFERNLQGEKQCGDFR